MKDFLLALAITTLIIGGIFGLGFLVILDYPVSESDIIEETIVVIEHDSFDNSNGYFVIYEDTNTGVQYVFIKNGYGGGLSPRYNSDGMIYVNKNLGVSV